MPIPSLGEIKLALAVIGIVLVALISADLTHKIDLAQLEKVELQYQQAQITAQAAAKVEQAALDKIGSDADQAALVKQAALLADAQKRMSGMAKHTPAGKNNCITWGLLQSHDADVFGVDPDTLKLPPGISLSSCATLSGLKLGSTILNNYEAKKQNDAAYLGLQDWANQVSKVKR
jgi:hypothetical protein